MGSGCGRQENRPEYNRLRVQLIGDLFEALQSNRPEAAVNAADRLSPLVEDGLFLELVAIRGQARIIITETNRRLVQGDPAAAQAFLKMHPELENLVPDIDQRLHRVTAAIYALQNHQRKQPFPNAEEGIASLESLVKNHEVLHPLETFREWEGQEKQRLVSLREQELCALIGNLYLKPTQGADRPRKNIVMKKLQDFADAYPDSALGELYWSIEKGNVQDLEQFFQQTQDRDKANWSASLLVNLQWPLKTADIEQLLWKHLRRATGRSPAVFRSRALLAAVNDDQDEAVTATREMIKAGGESDAQLLKIIMEHSVLPVPQYRARPWRTPLPQMHDILDITTQLREQKEPNKN